MTKDLVVLKVKRPDEALFKASEGMLDAAVRLEVTTPELAVEAGEELKKVKALAKQLEGKRTAITGPLNKALKEVNDLFRPAKEWLVQAERVLKSGLLDYQSEQDRIARERQEKADALARKEREKLEKRAAKATAKGKTEKAEALSQVAEATTAPVIESAAPKVAGVVRRETWKAEITDEIALIRYIVNLRPDLLGMVHVSQSALNDLARLHKDELNMPGVDVKKETSIAARAH